MKIWLSHWMNYCIVLSTILGRGTPFRRTTIKSQWSVCWLAEQLPHGRLAHATFKGFENTLFILQNTEAERKMNFNAEIKCDSEVTRWKTKCFISLSAQLVTPYSKAVPWNNWEEKKQGYNRIIDYHNNQSETIQKTSRWHELLDGILTTDQLMGQGFGCLETLTCGSGSSLLIAMEVGASSYHRSYRWCESYQRNGLQPFVIFVSLGERLSH